MAFVPPGSCPNCGTDVPRGARSCPECGSDEKSGWNDDTYLDGIDLPPGDEEIRDEADRIREREFGSRGPRSWKSWLATALIVVLILTLARLWIWR